MNLSSSPSPLDSILSSHPIYSSYEEGSNYLVSHPVPTVILDSNPCNSTLKGVFSASPFPSQCTSKPLSKKKASKRRSQVKNACVNCQKACKKCDEGRPCQRCIKLGITETCINSPRKERKKGFKRGPYRKKLGAVPQRIVSKKDLSLQHEPIPVLKIEENATKNYVPTYVSPNWQSHSPPPCLEKAQFYDESFDIEPNTDNIAEQRFYSFYSNSNDKQYSSFDSACQPKIITTPNNRVNDIIDNVPKINNLEQYNPLMVQRQSFSSDEYGFYPEIEPASQQDYLSPINYDYNFSAMPGNFGYGTNSFDMAYHAPQYTQQLVPKLQPTVSMIPQNYNTMTDINNTFPHQDLYANKNQYYAQDQTYYVEKNTAFIDTNQWVGKPNINSQHYYYNNQQF